MEEVSDSGGGEPIRLLEEKCTEIFFIESLVVEVSSRSFLRTCTSYLRSVQLRIPPYHITLCEPHAIRISSCCVSQCVP